jgi:queuine tRNA-ribosyltransferase
VADEILGLRLNTLHNIHFYLTLMKQIRHVIEDGTFAAFRVAFLEKAALAGRDETAA